MPSNTVPQRVAQFAMAIDNVQRIVAMTDEKVEPIAYVQVRLWLEIGKHYLGLHAQEMLSGAGPNSFNGVTVYTVDSPLHPDYTIVIQVDTSCQVQ